MSIKEQKEIQQLIQDSSRVLIATKEHPGFDEVSAALAWYCALKPQKKKRLDVIAHIPDKTKNRFKFLPGAGDIKPSVQAADHFIIQVDASKTKVKELSYDMKGTTLEIRVSPDGGNFSSKDVSFSESSFAYDLIIILGASELSSLGLSFEQSRELFFNTPVINIDRQSSNVRFGQVNAIYLTATSLAEISHGLLSDQLDKDVATCLLTGLIAATNSFQTPQVTPETLILASELIVAGASREEIVNHLYRTKDMDKLRVWGRVLARLRQVDNKIVYSDLKQEDIGTHDIDLAGLVDELVLASPEAHVVLFFFEATPLKTEVSVYGRENYDLPLMLQKYAPHGRRRHVTFTLEKNSADAEREILSHVKDQFRLIQH